jgi:hypothetical protein
VRSGFRYVARTGVGRRNRYTVSLSRPFRHSAQNGHLIVPFLDLLGPLATMN